MAPCPGPNLDTSPNRDHDPDSKHTPNPDDKDSPNPNLRMSHFSYHNLTRIIRYPTPSQLSVRPKLAPRPPVHVQIHLAGIL